jgi:hypothetical protein
MSPVESFQDILYRIEGKKANLLELSPLLHTAIRLSLPAC